MNYHDENGYADVYSLGISFYALCYYNLPYINGNYMHELMNDNFYSNEYLVMKLNK